MSAPAKPAAGGGRLRVGLVGCGHIAATHLRAWKRARGCEVVGVLDRDRVLAERRARQFGVGTVFSDLDELLPACDVVDVCTPPETHPALGRAVVSASRHLLVEKPIVVRLEEWVELQELSARHGAKLGVIHNLKFASGVMTARRWLTDGRIGRLIGVEGRFLVDPASDRMLSPGRHWSHALPGGRWQETLPHHLYLFHHLAGPLEVVSVAALAPRSLSHAVPAGEVMVTFRGSDCLGLLHYSSTCALNERSLTLFGTRGVIRVDLPSDAAHISPARPPKVERLRRAAGIPFLDAVSRLGRAVPDRLGYLVRRARRETAHARQIVAFARWLRGEGEAPTPLDEIDYVVRATEAIGEGIAAAVPAAADRT